MRIKIAACLVIFLIFSCSSKEIKNSESEIEIQSIEMDIEKSSVYLNLLKESSIDKLDTRIIGIWNTEFPVTSGTSGFAFFESGLFVFSNYKDSENIINNYSGSMGYWKIDENNLYINIIVDFYWKNGFLESPIGYVIDRDDELLHKFQDINWTAIGSLESYKKEDFDDFLHSAIFKQIQNSNILELKVVLYKIEDYEMISFSNNKDFSDLAISEIYRYYKSILSGNIIE